MNPTGRLCIVIAGAGVGGLTLAQRLRSSRHDVVVLEQQPGPAVQAQGYRLSLKRAGVDALRRSLPPALHELVVATRIHQATRMIFMDPDLSPKFDKPIPLLDPADGIGVNRQTLREVLSTGIDVWYGCAVTGFRADGQRIVVAAGGAEVEADLLVGADGTGSAVRRQLLPDAGLDELGRAIWGRTPLTRETLAWLPGELVDSFNRVVHPGGAAMSVVTCRAVEPVTDAAARLAPAAALTPVPDHLSWMVSTTAPVPAGDSRALTELAAATVDGWHPALARIVGEADPAGTFPVTIRSARPVAPWLTGGVTVLGDAVHTMSPGRGDGATVALRDAELLGTLLERPADVGALRAAAREYEVEMLDYAFRAVRASREQPFAPFFAARG